MRLSITHTTHYTYDRPVGRGLQRLRLDPTATHGQRVLRWGMELTGAHPQASYEDAFQNRTDLIALEPGATELIISCSGEVETADNAGILGRHEGFVPLWAYRAETPLTRFGPKLRTMAAPFAGRGDTLEMLHDLSAAVLDAVPYEGGHTDAGTTAEEAVAGGHGVCQDHAHIFVTVARHLGVPARYVSGYLMMNDRVEQDAGHAWAEAHVPQLGWVGFDVSNAISPDARYVRVATGRDYSEAAPVTGFSVGGGESRLEVRLRVEQQSQQ